MSTRSLRIHETSNPQIVSLPIDDIVPDSGQPRKTFSPETHRNLTRSIKATGQISPIVVRPGSEGKYLIVVGERRWRAAKEAGLAHLDCIVRDDIGEQVTREMQFAENCQRDDISPLEQARSFKEYIDRYGVSQSELSRRTGIPQRTISDRLTLLSLPASVHARIEAHEIGPYEAVRIAALPAHQQEGAAEAVSSGLIPGRMLDKLVKMVQTNPERPLRDIIKQLHSPQVIGRSPVRTAFDKGKSVTGRVELKKETSQTDVASILAISHYLGIRKQNECSDLKKRVCVFHSWSSREEIPQGAGAPVQIENPRMYWHVKPTPLFCAFCPINLELHELEDDLTEIEDLLEVD